MLTYCTLVGLCWLVDTGIGFWTPSTALSDPTIPFPLKIALLASTFFLWSLSLMPPAGLEALLARVDHSDLGRRVRRLAWFLLTWLTLFVMALSWLLYRDAGSFLGVEGLAFLRWNFTQVLLHILQVEETHLYLLIAGSGGLAALFQLSVRSLSRWIGTHHAKRVVLLSAVWFAVGALAPLAFSEPQFHTLRYQTSPLARFFVDGVEALASLRSTPRRDAQADAALTTEAKRLISIPEYLQTAPPGTRQPYNVIVILIESLRPDRLKRLGDTRDVMPNLNRLAETSLVFSHAYCQSTHSDYADVCTLSSHYPLRSRQHHYYTDIRYPRVLLYDILKPLGYRTAIFSSQNELWGGMLRYLDTGNLDVIFHAATANAERYVEASDVGFAEDIRRGKLTAGKIDDSVTVQAAINWIRQQPRRPFFIYMNLQSSHFPYRLPSHVQPAYTPCELTFPVSFLSYPADKTAVIQNRYDNSLRYMDEVLGKFLADLRSLGVMERTVLVVTGDSGEAFHEHGTVTHAGALWNEVLQVALLLHAPGVQAQIVETPVQHIDIPPSILHVLGLPPHPAFQGRDRLGEARGGNHPMYFIAQTGIAQASAVIHYPYKLISDWQTHQHLLFDLQRDPRETRNLFSLQPSIAEQLMQRLDRWQRLQLSFYDTPAIYTAYYPPSLE